MWNFYNINWTSWKLTKFQLWGNLITSQMCVGNIMKPRVKAEGKTNLSKSKQSWSKDQESWLEVDWQRKNTSCWLKLQMRRRGLSHVHNVLCIKLLLASWWFFLKGGWAVGLAGRSGLVGTCLWGSISSLICLHFLLPVIRVLGATMFCFIVNTDTVDLRTIHSDWYLWNWAKPL